jgi:hypothetical protein
MRHRRFAFAILSVLVFVLGLATAAIAQDDFGPPDRDNTNVFGVTFGAMKYVELHSLGVDAKYQTKTMTKGVTPLGFHAGLAGTVGLHNFDGELLKLFQGGVHLTSDKIGSPGFPLYGDFLFGFGNYFGATDKFFTIAMGADFAAVKDKPFKIRVEIAQTYDIGYEASWRFSGGIAVPMH